MIYFIYGSDIGQSRGFLRLLKDKAPKDISFHFTFDRKIEVKIFLDKVSNASLFGSVLFYFLEFSKFEYLGDKSSVEAVISSLAPNTVVFWAGDDADKRSSVFKFFSSNKDCDVKAFNSKPVTKIYPLIDALVFKDKSSFALAVSLIEKKEDAISFMNLLFQSFYNMLAIKNDAGANINPFVAQKLNPAAKKFTEAKIKGILSEIYKTELLLFSNAKDSLGDVFNLISFVVRD